MLKAISSFSPAKSLIVPPTPYIVETLVGFPEDAFSAVAKKH